MLLLGMEFSDSVVEGVLVAGSAALSESSFHQALESSLRYILEPETSIPQDDGRPDNTGKGTVPYYLL